MAPRKTAPKKIEALDVKKMYSVKVLRAFSRGKNAKYLPSHANVVLRGDLAEEHLAAGNIEVISERK